MYTKVKIILRAYPKTFEWEPLVEWEARINEFVENHDVVELAPIGMDGVMIRYKESSSLHPCPICGKVGANYQYSTDGNIVKCIHGVTKNIDKPHELIVPDHSGPSSGG